MFQPVCGAECCGGPGDGSGGPAEDESAKSSDEKAAAKADGTMMAGTEAAASVGSGIVVVACASHGKVAAAPSSAADISRIRFLVVSHLAGPERPPVWISGRGLFTASKD